MQACLIVFWSAAMLRAPHPVPRGAHVSDVAAVLDDLREESDELDQLVARVEPERVGARPTPAAGWTVAHQIAHLAWTDRSALLAVTDAGPASAREVEKALAAPDAFVDEAAEDGRRAAARRAARPAGGTGAQPLDEALRAAPPAPGSPGTGRR